MAKKIKKRHRIIKPDKSNKYKSIALVGLISGVFLLLTNLPTSNLQLSPGTSPINLGLILGSIFLVIGSVSSFLLIKRK